MLFAVTGCKRNKICPSNYNNLRMLLNYKTEKLPFNFIAFGVLLFVVGVWRIVVLDWIGIIFLLLSLFLVFIRSGIQIDSDKKRIKKYTGIFCFRKGRWEDISSVLNLRIHRVRETRKMNVLSITRFETMDLHKLFLVLPNREIELMMGEKDIIFERALKISALLDTSILDQG